MDDHDALTSLDERLAERHMRGQWKSEAFLAAAIGGARPAGAPAAWSWRMVLEMLDEAERAMPDSLQARRSLVFQNPALPRGTTHTINMAVQMIVPGEVAWAHRHSIAALRFIIEGDENLTTIVDGEHCVMQTGDLVLTPGWSWHDHHNQSNKRGFWLDVLDVPLVLSLNQTLYEPASGPDQPSPEQPFEGMLRYPWAEAEAKLMAVPLRDDLGQVHEYRDPTHGGPTLPTLMCSLVRLPPGFKGKPFRNSSSSVCFAVRGSGSVLCQGQTISWGPRDSFVIPNWSERTFSNDSTEDTVLFSVSDEPVLKALGLYRETAARS